MGQSNRRAMAATGNPVLGLSEKQRKFARNMVHGLHQTASARAAGFAFPAIEANRLMNDPKIIAAIQYLHRKNEKASQMTRKKVMDGLLEAIEMAKLQADPKVMVAGWREIGHMCGFYAPERKIIDVNITAKRAVDKLETLSDAELLEMIEKDSEAIEGEFTEVLEATQEAADAHFAEAGFDD